ncbi:hypothetical protein GCM10029964_096190 [Kibdelosporangium lantanae]
MVNPSASAGNPPSVSADETRSTSPEGTTTSNEITSRPGSPDAVCPTCSAVSPVRTFTLAINRAACTGHVGSAATIRGSSTAGRRSRTLASNGTNRSAHKASATARI